MRPALLGISSVQGGAVESADGGSCFHTLRRKEGKVWGALVVGLSIIYSLAFGSSYAGLYFLTLSSRILSRRLRYAQ
jgi:hypothetical protein